MPRPTQSIPAGFLIVFFGMLSFVFSGISCYVSWFVYRKQYVEQQATEFNLSSLILAAVLGFLMGCILFYVGLRMAYRTTPYDTRDPDQPNVKF